jgi:cytochrome c oxidase cbb3-type subunit 3
MADMPSDFWAGWIALITVISLGGMCWLIYSVYFTPGHDEPSPVWDENLSEGANPAPMWWFWFIFALLIFSVIYLMLYPGLGSYKGVLNWSQGGRLDQSYETYESKFGDVRSLVKDASIETLQTNTAAMQSAQRIYEEHCENCHGAEATGQADLFPDLRDAAWQWGGDETAIMQTLRGGRHAVMPGWQAALQDEGVDQVANYLFALGKGESVAADDPGQTKYQMFCAACHGVDGTGMAVLGGPNLVDDVWLYGGDMDAVRHSIAIGREGVMPAFGDRLDETQLRMLTAWLLR